MLIPLKDIVVYYLNTSGGHRILYTYDKLNFKKCIDMKNVYTSQQQALEELNQLAFSEFRCGRFIFELEEKHQKAMNIIKLDDEELIELIYSKDYFEADLVSRELKTRKII